MKTITAAEANRQFSQLLRGVRQGDTYLVTSRGTPVATLAPADAELRARAQARAALLTRLKAQPTTDIGRWSRDELYDDEADEAPAAGGTKA